MKFFDILRLGIRRHRSPEDYRILQNYLAEITIDELNKFGINLNKCDVLEIGAGPGGYSPLLFEEAKSFIASDMFPDPFFDNSPIPFRQFDVCAEFPFENESFDLIYCSSLIEHLAKPDIMLAQCRRVLRPGGALFVTFPPFYSLAMMGGHTFKPFHMLGERLSLFVHNKLHNDNVTSYADCYGGYGLYPLSIADVSHMIVNANFRITDIYPRMQPFNTCHLPGILKDLTTWHACYIARPV